MLNKVILSVGLALLSGQVFASSDVVLEKKLSGYATIVVDTNMEQKDPLSEVVSFQFTSGVTNVGQALNYVLKTTGYSLAPLDETSVEVLRLYTLPLPEVNYEFNSATVKQVMGVLVGSGYQVSVDELKRQVNVEVADAK